MEHTKGKWVTHNDIDGSEIIYAEDPNLGDVTIGRVYTGYSKGQRGSNLFPDWDTGIANARLIAAAPETKKQRDDLLAACKQARAFCMNWQDDDNFAQAKQFGKMISELTEAIAATTVAPDAK